MKFVKIIILFFAVIFASFVWKVRAEKDIISINDPTSIDWKSPSVRMYFALKTYSEKYNVPEEIAFAFAYRETGYRGPNHRNYEWRLVSSAGALGAMQIMPGSARKFAPKKYSDSLLLNDIDYNVETSMRILKYLKKRFGRWDLAAGAYNTGRPIVNEYARQVVSLSYDWL
jgi:soluble lytic murein transglycosylase-like protein